MSYPQLYEGVAPVPVCVTSRTEPNPPAPRSPFTAYSFSSVRRDFFLRHGRVRLTGSVPWRSEDVTTSLLVGVAAFRYEYTIELMDGARGQ